MDGEVHRRLEYPNELRSIDYRGHLDYTLYYIL